MALSLLPSHYGVVIIGNIVAPFITSMYLGSVVMTARKTYDVQYPNLYAVPGTHKFADAFNNVQRGHQNMLESAMFYIPMSLVAGLKHPLAVGIGGVFYCIGCLGFQAGYKLGPEKRNSGLGVLKYVGLLTTLVCSIKLAITLI